MFERDFSTGERRGVAMVRNRFNGLKSRIKPEKFGWKDIAQQLTGAFLLSAPFTVTEEVWRLANHLNPIRIGLLVGITVMVATLILYYSKYQKLDIVDVSEHIPIPRRMVSLFIISYGVAFLMLWTLGVIGVEITDPEWSLKLVVVVGFFSSVGAAAADVLR